jgi:iron-sulfur cluster repair protein YtfE (RIC family)
MATYDTDFHAWAFEQAENLRAGKPVDIANIAEELETLGRSEENQLTNRLAVLIQHLLKCEHQPDRRTASWDATIKEQRRRVARLLEQNPSLKAKLDECIRDAYGTAVTFASVETGILEEDFSPECEYTIDFILGRNTA